MPTHPSNEQLYMLSLSFVPRIGTVTARALVTHFGSAERVFKATTKELKQVEGVGDAKASHCREAMKDPEILKRGEKELKFIEKQEIQPLFYTDEQYPQRLKVCYDMPYLLYYKGNTPLNTRKIVAVVGTRMNTDYGLQLCEKLIAGLKTQENILIVSGLAFGIDTIAHKQSVSHNVPTVGVLGHGLDMVYPSTNKALTKEMLLNGGLLTEFPSGVTPEQQNFPMRNRIVAGMSDVTVVVESDLKGGALITARMACDYNRDVAAFPGRITDTKSNGCNELIRSHIASLITSADDLLDMMNWRKEKKKKVVELTLNLNMTNEEQKIVSLLKTKDSVHADELYHETGLASSQLAASLLRLEMEGIIKTLPGKNYRLN
jgi:DNA processing protein